MDIFCLTFLIVFGVSMTAYGLMIMFRPPPQPLIIPYPNRIGVADEIGKLSELKEKGTITDAEYCSMRKGMIGQQYPNSNLAVYITLVIGIALFIVIFFCLMLMIWCI